MGVYMSILLIDRERTLHQFLFNSNEMVIRCGLLHRNDDDDDDHRTRDAKPHSENAPRNGILHASHNLI